MLEDYQQGAGVKELATRTGRNPQTINKQIRLALEEREQLLARVELFRQVITKHNADLLGAIGRMRDVLDVPPDERLTPVALFPFSGYGYTGLSIVRQDREVQIHLPTGDEDQQRLVELVREHLSSQRQLWKDWDAWRGRMVDYARACVALGRDVGIRAADRLALPLVATGGSDEGIHEQYVTWLCRLAIEAALGKQVSAADPTLRIEGESLRYGGSTLATSPEKARLEKAQTFFRKQLQTLPGDTRIQKIAQEKAALEQERGVLRRRLGDLLLMGLVPGQCSACKHINR
jgi:hypothetical protein